MSVLVADGDRPREGGPDRKEIEASRHDALVWALERASRSGRVAYQFARDYAGRRAR